jgi:predicted O-methyltransferase YrrM
VSKYNPLDERLYGYLLEHGVRQDGVLRRLAEETEAMGDISVMQIAPDQGAFMTLLVRAVGARRALELGTFTGYSAICIARGLAEDGVLVACELSEEYAEVARRYFDEAGVAGGIDLRLGPALDTLRSMPADESFDFAFIDADKGNYSEYYEECLTRLRPGGLIAIDNVLAAGRVLDPDPEDESATAIAALNERIASDERVDVAMLAIADGVTLALKRESPPAHAAPGRAAIE